MDVRRKIGWQVCCRRPLVQVVEFVLPVGRHYSVFPYIKVAHFLAVFRMWKLSSKKMNFGITWSTISLYNC